MGLNKTKKHLEIERAIDKSADKVIKATQKKKVAKQRKRLQPLKDKYNHYNKNSLAYIDLRREQCWSFYIDPSSETYNNGRASAVRAGYSDHTAKGITSENWFVERQMRLLAMLPKAEEVLYEDLNMETHTVITVGGKKGKKGSDEPDEEAITMKIINPKLRKLRQDVAMFVAETVGRARYHKKKELDVNDLSLFEGDDDFDDMFK